MRRLASECRATGGGLNTVTIEVASRARRGVKRVHEDDVHVLQGAGILGRTEDRVVVFPYDAVHVDFMLRLPALAA
jgi:hypothetical protein